MKLEKKDDSFKSDQEHQIKPGVVAPLVVVVPCGLANRMYEEMVRDDHDNIDPVASGPYKKEVTFSYHYK